MPRMPYGETLRSPRNQRTSSYPATDQLKVSRTLRKPSSGSAADSAPVTTELRKLLWLGIAARTTFAEIFHRRTRRTRRGREAAAA
ncbi:hypothetical protein GCM10009753_67750 [Streptantibioticus ferralitis]